MSEGQITIGIPGTLATAFASSPIPALVIDEWDSGVGIPTRTPTGFTSISGRSNWGTAAITGPAHQVFYAWDVAAILSRDDAQQLAALALWQDREQKAGRLGALRLLDETDYLEPEPSPHSRTLLAALHPAWNAGYDYGFGMFLVQLSLPGDWREHLGIFGDGRYAKRVTFSLEEI